MEPFSKSKWIWNTEPEQNDEYVDLLDLFHAEKNKRQLLRISADSNYTVYINGQMAAFGQYADYPDYKIYDEIDISRFICEGQNRLVVVAWYYGKDTQTYIHGNAGVIYEIMQSGEIIAFSGEHTLSRQSHDYVSHRCELISSQLGFTYHYDATKYDGFIEAGNNGFAKSRIADGISYELLPRPIRKLELLPRMEGEIRQQGIFTYTGDFPSPAKQMQYAALAFRSMPMLSAPKTRTLASPVCLQTTETCDGIYLIIDLKQEVSGFPELEFDTAEECAVDIGYGEHLSDGRCRTAIRGFSCRYTARKGHNHYLNTFRRFGCRYLQVFFHTRSVKIGYIGIRPTVYPVTVRPFDHGNLLRKTIYDVCVNTLIQCMHEHYEDCPWREQALYTMDSRNQMLCGYYAFGEYQFARASLKLISKGLRDDGILSLCYPAGKDFPIPAFSTMYFVQMLEYIEHSHDLSLAEECYDVLVKIADTFLKKLRPEGYIENFYGYDSKGGKYWNFYEWSDTMDGSEDASEPSIETPLNAFFSLAMQSMAGICQHLSRPEDAERYQKIAQKINRAIETHLFDAQAGLFVSFLDRHPGEYSVLTNSLCLLCGAAEHVDQTNILKILEVNGAADTGLTVYPNTLSMNSFRFDALLSADREKYKNVILNEIDRDYLYMLREGATSFWETILGERDFDNAGSLCHGWSALPIYYYKTLLS